MDGVSESCNGTRDCNRDRCRLQRRGRGHVGGGVHPSWKAVRRDRVGLSSELKVLKVLSDYLLTYSLSPLPLSLPPYLPRAQQQAHIFKPFDEF